MQYDTIRYKTIQYDMIRYKTIRYDENKWNHELPMSFNSLKICAHIIFNIKWKNLKNNKSVAILTVSM